MVAKTLAAVAVVATPRRSLDRELQATLPTGAVLDLAGPMAFLSVATVAAVAPAVARLLVEVVALAVEAVAPVVAVQQQAALRLPVAHLDALMVKTALTMMAATMVWKNLFGIFTTTTVTLTSIF